MTLLAAEAGRAGSVTNAESKESLDYFGAKPPGNEPEIFAPGAVSLPERFEARIAFSSDLKECYLTETDATFSRPKLLVARRDKTGWTTFSPVPFAGKFKVCHEPFLSADNQRLYFTADGTEAAGNLRDLWVTKRRDGKWGEPSRLPPPINSNAAEFFFSQSSEGTVLFASNRSGGRGDFDLYYVEKTNDGADRAVNFGPDINSPGPEYDPCISRDGRTLVFASARNGARSLDLYVSFRDDAKTWSKPVALKAGINTAANEYAPVFSPDGRYLFFVRHDGKLSDVYWMATSGVTPDRYRPELP